MDPELNKDDMRKLEDSFDVCQALSSTSDDKLHSRFYPNCPPQLLDHVMVGACEAFDVDPMEYCTDTLPEMPETCQRTVVSKFKISPIPYV